LKPSGETPTFLNSFLAPFSGYKVCEDIFLRNVCSFLSNFMDLVQECRNLNTYQGVYIAEIMAVQCLRWLFGGL